MAAAGGRLLDGVTPFWPVPPPPVPGTGGTAGAVGGQLLTQVSQDTDCVHPHVLRELARHLATSRTPTVAERCMLLKRELARVGWSMGGMGELTEGFSEGDLRLGIVAFTLWTALQSIDQPPAWACPLAAHAAYLEAIGGAVEHYTDTTPAGLRAKLAVPALSAGCFVGIDPATLAYSDPAPPGSHAPSQRRVHLPALLAAMLRFDVWLPRVACKAFLAQVLGVYLEGPVVKTSAGSEPVRGALQMLANGLTGHALAPLLAHLLSRASTVDLVWGDDIVTAYKSKQCADLMTASGGSSSGGSSSSDDDDENSLDSGSCHTTGEGVDSDLEDQALCCDSGSDSDSE